MPAFFEDELEAVIWTWIAEIVSNPDKIDEALVAINEQASQQNGHILSLLKTVNALIEAKLVNTYYSPEYIRDVKAACAKISEGMNNFTRDEKRETFDLLDLHGKFAIEDGYKVVYAECILDARRLVIKANGGGGEIANRTS